MEKLRSILRYIGACDGNMQEGSLRADANVSVRRPGDPLGTRCEIKNVNSIRFLKQAVEYEAARQIEIIEDGGTIDQETRLFDAGKGETRSMRSKEDAHDYRYFPDPDLLPLDIEPGFVEQLKETLPELPDGKKARFVGDYGLSPYDASVLAAERETAEFFETVAKGRDAKLAAHVDVLRHEALTGVADESRHGHVLAGLADHRGHERRDHGLHSGKRGAVDARDGQVAARVLLLVRVTRAQVEPQVVGHIPGCPREQRPAGRVLLEQPRRAGVADRGARARDARIDQRHQHAAAPDLDRVAILE